MVIYMQDVSFSTKESAVADSRNRPTMIVGASWSGFALAMVS